MSSHYSATTTSSKSVRSSDSDYNGAAIILWYFDPAKGAPILLVGKESIYVKDLLVDKKFEQKFGSLLYYSEHFDTSELVGLTEEVKLQAAKDHFSIQSDALEREMKKEGMSIGRIQFDTPSKHGHVFTVNYRYLPKTNYKRGIIKGRKEVVDLSNPIKTAVREFAEEFGLKISSGEQQKIRQIGQSGSISNGDHYKLFALEIENSEVFNIFLTRIHERTRTKMGELFEFSFKTIHEIDAQFDQYNSKTKYAVQAFKNVVIPEIGYPASKKEHSTKGGKRRKTIRKYNLQNKTVKNKL